MFISRYLYLVPADGNLVLQIGGRHNMNTSVTDVNNEQLTQVIEKEQVEKEPISKKIEKNNLIFSVCSFLMSNPKSWSISPRADPFD